MRVKNHKQIALTKNREIVLDLIETGLEAINTKEVINQNIKLVDNVLTIQGQAFNLNLFENIKVVGFGKASCQAASALEEVLGNKIQEGAVVGLKQVTCNYIDTYSGTHPKPSFVNVEPGKKIFDIANNSTEKDLLIVIVSGGGSALLCYPEDECIQGEKLYEHFLKSGESIVEMNTVRKHLSLLKGGGLAKIAYPATVIGLIFSDVPGDSFNEVASGPTYKDETTISDAESLINKYNLGNFKLTETPKEDKYFEKVHNFVLVSNKTAISKIKQKAEDLGFKVKIISTDLYDEVSVALNKIFDEKKENTVVLAAGEPKLKVTSNSGTGGRNLYMGLKSIELNDFSQDEVFVSLASDGMDNSASAGAFVDQVSIEKIKNSHIDIKKHLADFDAYTVFEKTGDLIMTGPTDANVSDIMILLKKHE
jgi:glycerate-2-kinase